MSCTVQIVEIELVIADYNSLWIPVVVIKVQIFRLYAVWQHYFSEVSRSRIHIGDMLCALAENELVCVGVKAYCPVADIVDPVLILTQRCTLESL